MRHIEDVYEAVRDITADTKKPVNPFEIKESTGLSIDDIELALRQLYATKRIDANCITSTGRDNHGELIEFSEIKII